MDYGGISGPTHIYSSVQFILAVVVVTTFARVRSKAQTKLVGPFLLKFVERDLQALALSFASNCH